MYVQLREFEAKISHAFAKNIIVHINTNHIPRDKICRLLLHICHLMPSAEIYHSGILPKSGKESVNSINLTNEEVFNFCADNQEMHFIGHNAFAVNGNINVNLLLEHRAHKKRGAKTVGF